MLPKFFILVINTVLIYMHTQVPAHSFPTQFNPFAIHKHCYYCFMFVKCLKFVIQLLNYCQIILHTRLFWLEFHCSGSIFQKTSAMCCFCFHFDLLNSLSIDTVFLFPIDGKINFIFHIRTDNSSVFYNCC